MVSWWWVDGDLVGYNMWYAWHLSIFNMGCKNGISWWDDKSWIIHRYGDIWMGFNEILMGFYGIPYMIYGCLSALFLQFWEMGVSENGFRSKWQFWGLWWLMDLGVYTPFSDKPFLESHVYIRVIRVIRCRHSLRLNQASSQVKLWDMIN